MDTERQKKYIENLQRAIRLETVSDPDCGSAPENFERFHALLWELFPNIRKACELKEIDGALLLKWKGRDQSRAPVLFMNHHDVVPARAEDWKYPPFSGEVAEGKIWGRGTLDDKGGLWAMLQAADELAAEEYVPARDIYFMSDCNEETLGQGAKAVVAWLKSQGIGFDTVFDEGGDIVREPIRGAKGTIAMVGVGEKAVVNLRFVAKSAGGHASTPEKNTPLVRLGKFMAYVDRHQVFDVDMPPAIAEMLKVVGKYMGKVGKLMGEADKIRKPLGKLMPVLGPTTGALVSTTIAFTMTGGGEAFNVIPGEAWVIANMRCSHHQGKDASIAAITKVAKRFGVETEVLEADAESRLTDHNGWAFRLVSEAVMKTVPGVDACAPYIMTGASDARFLDPLSDQCIRFLPFTIDSEQLDSIHGVNEWVSVDTLVPAVDYYRYMYQRV